MTAVSPRNVDLDTVAGFGEEWEAYSQESLGSEEHRRIFADYFAIFPFDDLPPDAEGFDLGCGTGRWAVQVAERVGRLHCIDPAAKALAVARRRLAHLANVEFHEAIADEIPLAECSQDFGYSLGVLHHIPDTAAAMRNCVARLKPGAPFLVYLYYAFDNRPAWFRWLWRLSDRGRRTLSRWPFPAKKAVTTLIAATIYWPLATSAKLLEVMRFDVSNVPLSYYRNSSFYTMRTDALDRFGTRLEQRYTRAEIAAMMERCGLDHIQFHEGPPYWIACGRRMIAE